MSADLITYFNFIACLENATDDQLNDIISERANFIAMGGSNMMDMCNNAVDSVFNEIDKLAKQLEEEKIADDSVKIAEDAAAVASIWSFGLSMAVYAALEVTDQILQCEIKKTEDNLNNHLASADKDIVDQIGGACAQYIGLTKSNNKFLKESSPAGLSAQTARSYLYSHMDFLETHGGVTLENFRKYIDVTKKSKDNDSIGKVYDLLDLFKEGYHTVEAIKETLEKMHEIVDTFDTYHHLIEDYDELIRHYSIKTWVVTEVTTPESLAEATKEIKFISVEDTEIEVFEHMGIMNKAMGGLDIAFSVVSAVFSVYDIVETVERYKKSIEVYNTARQQYKDFYKHMYDASVKYNNPSRHARVPQ